MACVLVPAQQRLPPIWESGESVDQICWWGSNHPSEVHHHGCAGGVADPHGEQGSWEHEAKKHLHTQF